MDLEMTKMMEVAGALETPILSVFKALKGRNISIRKEQMELLQFENTLSSVADQKLQKKKMGEFEDSNKIYTN